MVWVSKWVRGFRETRTSATAANKDGHGKHTCCPTSVMDHLEKAHCIEGVEWPEVDDDLDDFLASLSLRRGG